MLLRGLVSCLFKDKDED